MLHAADPVDIFPWNANFETGVPLIDEQHKRLVDLLNRLAGDPALNRIIDELADYADYHFQAEEAIWTAAFAGDDWLLSHQKAHKAFFVIVADMRKSAGARSSFDAYQEILRFLINWLAQHILDKDLRMARVLSALDQGLGIEQAKADAEQEMSGSMRVFIDALLAMYDDLSSRTLELMRERWERSRVEEALRMREQHERAFSDTVISSIPGLLYLYDDELRLMRWNQRHVDALGYSDQELQGKSALDFFAAEKHEKIMSALSSLADGRCMEMEEEVVKSDGSCAPYLLTGMTMNIDGRNCVLGTGIDISRLKAAEPELESQVQDSKNALIGTVIAVSRAMEARDPYTSGHQQRVAELAVAVARRLGLDEHRVEGLRLGASVHDIGKLGVPVELLVKPNRLTELEYGVVKTHVQSGADILKEVAFPWPILEIVSQHHERMDGSGYPYGLKGHELCMEVRIVAVVDVYEAMSAHRPYRASLGKDTAVDELKRNRGRLYDAEVVDALFAVIEEIGDVGDLHVLGGSMIRNDGWRFDQGNPSGG